MTDGPLSDEALALVYAAFDANVARFKALIEEIDDPEIRARLTKMLKENLPDLPPRPV